MIYTRVLNRGHLGVQSPADLLPPIPDTLCSSPLPPITETGARRNRKPIQGKTISGTPAMPDPERYTTPHPRNSSLRRSSVYYQHKGRSDA